MSAKFPALLFVAGFVAAAQDPPTVPVEQPMLRVTFTLVQVDAVVTDSAGRRVVDLKPTDFEVRQDGVLQKVTHFSYFPDDRAPQIPPAKTKGGLDVPVGTMPLMAAAVKRTVSIVVDDRGLSFESIVRVREALRKYVEQTMQPGDLVSIIRTGGGVSLLEQFTNDKKVLLTAIDLLKWRFGGRTGLLSINPLGDAKSKADGPELLDYDQGMQALGTLSTLDQVIRGMRKLPGRKSVVFISESMRMEARINSKLDHLTDLANRAAVSLYAIDPAGLTTKGITALPEQSADEPDSVRPSIGGGIFTGMGAPDYHSQDGLDYLAKRTGGLFIAGRNDIPRMIQQAVDDQMGYYLLGYSPPEGTFEQDSKKSKFRRVTVRVKRSGVQVRWKAGFDGSADGDGITEPVISQSREQQLLEALASPFAKTDLGIRLTCFYADYGAAHGAYVRSMLFFQGKDLTFKPEPGNFWHASVDIVTSAYRGIKEPIQQRQRREEIRLPEATYQKAMKEGFLFSWDYQIKEPGTFMMRAVVRDAETSRIGAASQSLTVPDTRKGQLAMSGVVIKLATPEMLGIKAPPVTAANGTAEAWAEGGPAVRRYMQGQNIVYSFLVVNPKRKSSDKTSQITKELLVYKDGKLQFRGDPLPVDEKGRLDERSVAGSGILKLGTTSPPGEYVLQIVATDKLAPKKKSKVTQWIDFEVVKAPVTKVAVSTASEGH